MLEKMEGKRRRGWQRMRWLASITDSVDTNLSKLQESGGQRSLESMGSQRIGHDLVAEQQQQRLQVQRVAESGLEFMMRIISKILP